MALAARDVPSAVSFGGIRSWGRLTGNYVSDMERGLKAPTLTMILKLSRVLRVSVAELLIYFTPETVRKLRLE